MYAIRSYYEDGAWSRTEIVKGDPGEWPRSGASEIAVGTFNKKRFFVRNNFV